MPILTSEPDLYPLDLLEREDTGLAVEPDDDEARRWYAIYTLSRREKDLMRRLFSMEIPFYCPIIPQRRRSPAGRIRESFLPLFSNYVFVYGTTAERYKAFTTNCIASDVIVTDGHQLTRDLRQIHKLVQAGVPLTRESKIQPGQYVRVRSGAFRNYEGTVIRREGERRLLIHVNFLQQGASVLLDDCEVELR